MQIVSPITLVLIPYLVAYLLAWQFNLDLEYLLKVYWLIHLVVLTFALKLLWALHAQIKLVDITLFVLLFLVFLLPGAYLEYPSDTWEHFRRIFRWSELGVIENYPANSKFKLAYFWGFSILSVVDFDSRRISLDLYSAFWQLATCYQIYRLARYLNCSKALSYLNVFGFIALFGSNVFSFRYYALSSTPLAYILYLEVLILAVHALKVRSINYLWQVPILLVGIYLNHLQELLFVCLVMIPIGLTYFDQNIPQRLRFLFRATATILVGLSFVCGYFLFRNFPEIYSNMNPGQIGRFGHFRVWNSDFKYYQETIGVSGLLAIILSICFFSKNKLLFTLVLTPIVSLIFPPTAAFYANVIDYPYLTYRVLYAIPLSLGFICGAYYLLELVARYASFFSRSWIRIATIIIFLLVVSLPDKFPYRGRLFFQLYKVPAERELLSIDQTAKWFLKNRNPKILQKCWLITDNATRTVIASHVGMNEYYYGGEAIRRARILPAHDFQSTASILEFSDGKLDFCGVLVGIKERIPHLPSSRIATSSGHWPEDIADFHWLTHDDFITAASGLTEHGWIKTFVPPYYYFYENPKIMRQQ